MNSGIIDSVLSKRGVVAKLAKLPYYSYLLQTNQYTSVDSSSG